MEHLPDWIMAVTGGVGLGVIWWQLRLQTKQALYDALNDLHRDLVSDEMHQSIRLIYSSSSEHLDDPNSPELLRAVERVLATYDMVGFRVKKGVLPKSAVLETEWTVLLRLWEKVGRFVCLEKERRRFVPYKEHFSWLVTEAQRYKERKFHHEGVSVFPRLFQSREGQSTADGASTSSRAADGNE